MKIELKQIAGIIAFTLSVLGTLTALGLDPLTSIYISLLVIAFLVIGSLQVKIIESKDKQYSFIRGDEGKELMQSIEASERSIMLTSFSLDEPTEEYISLMLRKLEDGVTVTRVIDARLSSASKPDWLKQFEGRKHYVERTVKNSVLPFDVYIFDDVVTKIYFPDSHDHEHFKRGVKFDNSSITSMFKTALYKLNS